MKKVTGLFILFLLFILPIQNSLASGAKGVTPEITSEEIKNATCPGSATGEIKLSVQGTSNLNFSWTGPDGFSSSSEDISQLKAGTYILTITDEDPINPSITKEFTLTDKDLEGPVVTLKNVTIRLDETGTAIITQADVDNGSSDNCGIDKIQLSKTSFNCTNIGENIIEVIITDKSGNSSTGKTTVFVEDNLPPVLPILEDLKWSCGKEIPVPVASDNCSSEIQGESSDALSFSTPGNYTVEWTFKDGNGNSVSGIQKVHIPEPNLEKPENIVVCAGEEIKVPAFQGSFSGTSFTWTNNNPAIGLASAGEGNIPVFTAKNETSEAISAEVTVIPHLNKCSGEPPSFTITVNPLPKADSQPEEIFLCNGVDSEVIPLSSKTPGTTFDISGGSSIGLSDKTGVTNIPVFTPVNNSSQPVSIPLEINPKANGCSGITFSLNVTVYPTAGISVSSSGLEICSGETTDLTFSSSTNSEYQWEIITIEGEVQEVSEGLKGTGYHINQTLTNTSNSQKAIVTFKIVPIANSCEGAPVFVDVTVLPSPTIAQPENIEVCSGSEVAEIIFSGSEIPSTNFQWENDHPEIGLAASGTGNIPSFEAKNTADKPISAEITVIPVAGDCKGEPKIFTITVNPEPQLISLEEAPGFCSETAFNYEFESNIPGTKFSWSRKSISGISTPPNSGTGNISEVIVNTTTQPIQIIYEVTLISTKGCISTTEIKTTVTPTPIFTGNLTPPAVCSGTEFSYHPESTTGGTVFKWKRTALDGIINPPASGTGAINEVLENTTSQTLGVTYAYTLSSNNCENPEIYYVTVSVTPSPKTTVSASVNDGEPGNTSFEICPGESIDLFSSTTLPAEGSLPPVLLESNFNSGSDGWTNPATNGNNWIIAPDGKEAYVDECLWWEEYWNDCEDETVLFHSNTNDEFFLISNYQTNENFNDVSLVSPVFSTKDYHDLELTFWHHYRDGGEWWSDAGDIGFLEFRVKGNDGNWRDWQHLDDYRSTEGDADDFVQKNYSLDQLLGFDEVQIRFRYDNAENDFYWAIDNIKISGDGSPTPAVLWTSDTGSWTSEEANPENIIPAETTVYTATYTHPETNCPGSASIKVIVKDPPQPKILADFCASGEINKIQLSADKVYDRYEWSAAGRIIGDGPSIEVGLAQAYTLRVWENSCEGSVTTTISENLITNGDFEDGNEGFNTVYNYVAPGGDLYPEGYYAVDEDASEYHNDFFGLGHGGDGNFMIVNGDPSRGNVVWESGIIEIQPETDYYFSAWTANLVAREEARLRLQITIPGRSGSVAESTLGNLTDIPVGEWIQFYNPEVWNSGENTQVILRIINENPVRDGNDFGIDDISFAALDKIEYSISPPENIVLCEGETLIIDSEISGGKDPVFTWAGPDGEVIPNNSEAPSVLQLENISVENSGIYTLSVIDFYGCEPKTAEITVEIPKINLGEDFSVCAEVAKTEGITLNAEVSGLISREPSGKWSGGSGTFEGSENGLSAVYFPAESELLGETIDLSFTSTTGCTGDISVTINPTLVISVESTNTSCFGGSDGTATVIVEGEETETFTFLWNDPKAQKTQTATDLPAGEYWVTVKNSSGCSVTSETVIIKEPSAVEILEKGISEPLCGGSSGTAFVTVSGGNIENLTTPEYQVSLFNDSGAEISSENISIGTSEAGKTTISAKNLVPGKYTFNISAGASCAATAVSVSIPFLQCLFLDFDGVDDYVDLGNNFSGFYSVGTWIRPESPNGTILSNKDESGNGFELVLNAGKPEFNWNKGSVTSSEGLKINDRWYHLAVSFNGSHAKLFIDGILISEYSGGQYTGSNSALLIGAEKDLSGESSTKDHFSGWIEEVRLWKTTTTKEQIRFLMNQRLQKGTDHLGAEIPVNAPQNLTFSDLGGYFQLLTGKINQNTGTTPDLANDENVGKLVNMYSNQENTAPVPYFSANDGSWADNSTWAEPQVWDIPNSTGITGAPIDWNIVRISNNIISGDKNLKLLALISEKAELTITDPSETQNEYNPGHSLRITHYLELDGMIDLTGESQLLQDPGSILEEDSKGYLERDQQGTRSSYHYNYWSSPVSNQRAKNNSGFEIARVLFDGTTASKPGPVNYHSKFNWADGPHSSPIKISTYWINTYTNFRSNSYSMWNNVQERGHIHAGEGYTMKGTSGSAEIQDRQNYVFTGKPNNGIIKLNLDKGNDYLIGNPYPSSIDAYEFIKDNLAERRNGRNIFNGSLYFWDHFGGKTHYLQEYIGGYGILNLSGSVRAVATDERINATGEKSTTAPQRYIPVAQGFYVSTSLNPLLGKVAGGEIIFKNSQRVFQTDDQPGDESIFKTPETKGAIKSEDSRQKIFLEFNSPEGYLRQILVTKDPLSTFKFDMGYDALLLENNKEDMFWMMGDFKLLIQGISDFGLNRKLPLGIKIRTRGEMKIAIDTLNNLPEEFNIFLHDSLDNSYYNLKLEDYKTIIDPGTYTGRFTIVFQKENISQPEDEEEEPENGEEEQPESEGPSDETPSEPEDEKVKNLSIFYVSNRREIIIKNPDQVKLHKVDLYTISGQLLRTYQDPGDQTTVRLPVKRYSQGVYLLKLFSETGNLVKKVVLE